MSDELNQAGGMGIQREPLDLSIGALVSHAGKVYRISETLDFSTIVGTETETGRSCALRVGELEPLPNSTPAKSMDVDLDDIGDSDWQTAQKRYAAIKPIVEGFNVTRKEVESRAKEVGVATSTLYRWISDYSQSGILSSLIPGKRGWKEGESRISKHVEDVISEVIEDTYLTVQRSSVQKVITEVKRRCMERGLNAPSPSTVRARVGKISERTRLRRRGHREKAINKFRPATQHFPDADYPLAVVQIDHTPLDIILVDDIYRLPIGRPWLTLAIDVFSRMVTGYYLSFDPPSGMSVAMCVSQAILPKEAWLNMLGIETTWDVWGVMDKLHADNGPDFRAMNLRQSCEMYSINLGFRPVKQPKYGGHIERLLGTFSKEVHELPGTTFSNVKERDGYDSEKHACMTITELERWLVTLICKKYHQKLHSEIGMAPSKKWEIGIFGNTVEAGRGIPPRPSADNTIFLDFLPSSHRTIQTYGVAMDGVNYYADVLRPWINATVPGTKDKRKFIFRRDPRDISTIWFFDPELKQYFRVPFANQALPSMSIWEYQRAKEKAKKEADDINEHEILRAITELRTQVDEAKAKTKKARRMHQRRTEHEKRITPDNPAPQTQDVSKPALTELQFEDDLLDGEILGFEDIS